MKKITLLIITSLLIMPICLSMEAFEYVPSPQVIQNRMEDLELALDLQKSKTDFAELKLSNLQASSDRKAKRREARIFQLKEQVKKYECDFLQQLKRDIEKREEKMTGLQEKIKQYDGELKGLKRDLAEAKKTNEELKLWKNAIKEEHKLAIQALEKGYKEEIFRLKQELVSLTLKNNQKNNVILSLIDKSVQTDDFITSSTPIPDIISVSKGVETDHWNDCSMLVSEDKSRGGARGWSTRQVTGISVVGASITLLISRLGKIDKQKGDTLQEDINQKDDAERKLNKEDE